MPGNPWRLRTSDGSVEYAAFRDTRIAPAALVVKVGARERRYNLRCLEDLHEMLKAHGDWVPVGRAGEHEQPPAGSVEAWARSRQNPVGGWYGLSKGQRGDFAAFIPPILQELNLAELEGKAPDLLMRAV